MDHSTIFPMSFTGFPVSIETSNKLTIFNEISFFFLQQLLHNVILVENKTENACQLGMQETMP